MRELQYCIDITKQGYNYKACMQNDTCTISIEMYKNGSNYSLIGATAKLNWVKPDNTPLSADMVVNGNVATVEIDKGYTDIYGLAKFDVEITNNGTTSTFPLELDIIQKVFNSEKVNNNILKMLETLKISEAMANAIGVAVESVIAQKIESGELALLEIMPGTITQRLMKIPYAEGSSKNLFDKNYVTIDSYVDYTDGKVRSLEGCVASDYIRVCKGLPYYLQGTRQQFALYNTDKEFVSGKAGFTSLETPIIVPEVDGFVRLTIANAEIDSVQLEQNSTMTEYEPYKICLDNNSISDINIDYINTKLEITSRIIAEINNRRNKVVLGRLSRNLFDKNTIMESSYVDYTDGKVRELSTCVASDYIDIHLFNNITISGTKQQYATYDENKTFLRGGIRADEFAKQEGDYYIRLTIANAEIDDVQVEEGAKATDYESFGMKLLNTSFSDENINYLSEKMKITKENIITVKQDGTEDYTTIFEAVTSITNSNKDNQYWIHVHEGTYHMNEEILKFSDFTKHPKGLFLPDFVHLVGIGDKRKIILDCTFADDVGLTISTNFSTLNLNKSNIVKNLTVKAKNCRYAIHDETNGVVENYTRELDNCDVIHEGNAEGLWQWDCAYGIGFGGGSKFLYRNCTFETKSKTIGNASFGGHNWDNQSNYSEFEFEGCNFLHSGLQGTENEVAFRMGATGNQYQDRFVFKGCNFNTGKIRLKKESTADTIEFVVGGYANKHIDLDYPDIEPTTLPEFIATEN